MNEMALIDAVKARDYQVSSRDGGPISGRKALKTGAEILQGLLPSRPQKICRLDRKPD